MSSNPKLVVECDRYLYRLAWFFPDEDDIGVYLGEEATPTDLNETRAQDASYATARACGGSRDDRGFYWESESAAKKAKTAVNAAIKAAEKDTPLPDWAVKALAAGWKAPKGWKP